MKIENIKKPRKIRKTQKNSYFLMSVASLYTPCFVMFCVLLYGPFCHGAQKLELTTFFTTFFFEHLFHLYGPLINANKQKLVNYVYRPRYLVFFWASRFSFCIAFVHNAFATEITCWPTWKVMTNDSHVYAIHCISRWKC